MAQQPVLIFVKVFLKDSKSAEGLLKLWSLKTMKRHESIILDGYWALKKDAEESARKVREYGLLPYCFEGTRAIVATEGGAA